MDGCHLAAVFVQPILGDFIGSLGILTLAALELQEVRCTGVGSSRHPHVSAGSVPLHVLLMTLFEKDEGSSTARVSFTQAKYWRLIACGVSYRLRNTALFHLRRTCGKLGLSLSYSGWLATDISNDRSGRLFDVG